MEKGASKDGKKRARDESKPGKAPPKDGPIAKKCGPATFAAYHCWHFVLWLPWGQAAL